jgi:hypothetical protein
MPNFVAAGILSGLGLVAARAIQAAEPGDLGPDLSSNDAAWVLANLDYIVVPADHSPTRNDPGHPYVTNDSFRAGGAQPTFRVADLTNPNIKPWAKEIVKRVNDKRLCRKQAAFVRLPHACRRQARLLNSRRMFGRDACAPRSGEAEFVVRQIS